MSGVLLDTHALLWLYQPQPMSLDSLLAIERAALENRLMVSPISAWELSAAVRKKNPSNRPGLGGLSSEDWFQHVTAKLQTTSCTIDDQIGLAAASLPEKYGSADPGDCFLLASAHAKRLTLITRDQRILAFGRENPDYLDVIRC